VKKENSMDRQELKRREERRAIRLMEFSSAIPSGRYGVVVAPADPRLIDSINTAAAKNCLLPLTLHLPGQMLREAFKLIDASGFCYKTNMLARDDGALVLLGVRGRVPAPAPGTQWPSVVTGPDAAQRWAAEFFPRVPTLKLAEQPACDNPA
jgi:hypothetical protein